MMHIVREGTGSRRASVSCVVCSGVGRQEYRCARKSQCGRTTGLHVISTGERRRRSTRSSIGPKILVAAVVVVAGVIGISGIYPQIIDSEWVQGPSTHSQRVAHSEPAPTTRRVRHRCGDSAAAAACRGDHRRGRRTAPAPAPAVRAAATAPAPAAAASADRVAAAPAPAAPAPAAPAPAHPHQQHPPRLPRPRSRRCVRRRSPPPNSRQPIRMPRSPTFRTPRPRPIPRPIPPRCSRRCAGGCRAAGLRRQGAGGEETAGGACRAPPALLRRLCAMGRWLRVPLLRQPVIASGDPSPDGLPGNL